jgi:tripartite-type tricarboxylate transporter receptor subunit TctC
MNRFSFLCALVALALAGAPLHAQDYPKGSVSLVVPLAPGDATDTAARAIADELSRELKVAIVPVNRPGAGGALGTELVVKAKPDGHTIVLTNNAALVFRSILDPKTANYNALTDLTPLGLAMRSPSILAVRSDAPYKTLKEMVEHAKRNPGSVRIGTAGAAR